MSMRPSVRPLLSGARWGTGAFGALALFAVALLAAAPAGAQEAGFIAAVEGTVEVQPAGSGTFALAAIDQELSVGDTLRTGPDSAVKVLLVDDTILTLGEETTFTIESLHTGPAATRETSVLKLLEGRVRTIVGEAFGGTTRVEVHTPTATVGVKGTDFITDHVREPREYSTVCLVEGGIYVRHRDQRFRDVASPAPGQCIGLAPDIAPEYVPPVILEQELEKKPPRSEVARKPTVTANVVPEGGPEVGTEGPVPVVEPLEGNEDPSPDVLVYESPVQAAGLGGLEIDTGAGPPAPPETPSPAPVAPPIEDVGGDENPFGQF